MVPVTARRHVRRLSRVASTHRRRRLDSHRCSESVLYLSADDVMAAMPPVAERLDLAERTMTALVADAELPPKIGVHPRPAGSFAHAMPAPSVPRPPPVRPVRGTRRTCSGSSGSPASPTTAPRAAGDPRRRRAQRPGDRRRRARSSTAARSPRNARRPCRGVAIARFGPIAAATAGAADHAATSRSSGRAYRAAATSRSSAHVLPGRRRSPSSTATRTGPTALAEAARGTAGIARRPVRDRMREAAVAAADVVITAASFADPPSARS